MLLNLLLIAGLIPSAFPAQVLLQDQVFCDASFNTSCLAALSLLNPPCNSLSIQFHSFEHRDPLNHLLTCGGVCSGCNSIVQLPNYPVVYANLNHPNGSLEAGTDFAADCASDCQKAYGNPGQSALFSNNGFVNTVGMCVCDRMSSASLKFGYSLALNWTGIGVGITSHSTRPDPIGFLLLGIILSIIL